ncbi:hypothetical protein HBH56_209510 [Parastagonospora nodorum]|nr:hypothetical protein HBH56_209510 [Parastagonospora nodorum]QRC99700.1 hypothetical protein JI435_149800 [Parastagonospora nodorum SN15]KAH3923693.1 hypothetical protein HBH54_208380 [Parastagonospora nodorum]KAH4049922.1 hypothetical protein HBH49_139670 [Parastagonospora nodorum]KAH4129306.1 hypothetical protein HBH45_207230 [Parastagonospora nodorum]
MAASTFSYAQAAKGMSTPVAQSKPTSGAATPAKEADSSIANGPADSVPSWADDAESESATEQPATARDAQPQTSASTAAPPAHSVETSNISSPDLGASASSASTVTKDDDVSSLPNASSESTWDNKSQASTSVDKSVEAVEKTSDKVKKGKSAPVVPLQEAPLPAVNIWKKRADDLKSKIQKPSFSPLPNGSVAAKKPESATNGGKFKSNDDDRTAHGRKDTRGENDAKKDSKAKSFDKDFKHASSTQPPPPKRDQESWPTPETVINEDRKKAQEKGEKEQKENISAASHGKHEWVKVPYTPSVVFNTPLPNATNPRRGGRPGGRGASQSGGRAATYGPNGAVQPEKDGSAPVMANGEHTRRERTEGGAPQDVSPKAKRTGSAASPTLKAQGPATTAEKPMKAAGNFVAEAEFRSRTSSSAPDANHQSHQNGPYPRQYPSRPHKPRRGDMSFGGERKKDGDVSPTKDNTFDERQNSTSTQTDAPGDSERRHFTYHDGPNGHQHKQGRYSSFTGGRERGRGGGRGGRGNYANGHISAQSASSFSLGPRSPTTFHPETSSFFTPGQGKYGRGNSRSQSMTNDPYRFAPYQGGPPVAPIQTYGMYDYGMMQPPMSAVPYTPYMDQYALMAMITTQVDYYFSVDNLLKDMYLRRKMDSQGFVSLEFIAGFNRIKHLSTDLELIKLVCQQSKVVQYRTGEDGQDRLRRREGWEQWVLTMADRDPVAQNDGPKELHQPPVPQPAGFDQSGAPQWPMSAVEPTGPIVSSASISPMNGYGHGSDQDKEIMNDSTTNGSVAKESNGVPNGHPVETSIKA